MTTIANIQLDNIFSKVQQLSAFEGRGAYTPSGESDFEAVHVTEQDKPWISSMAEEGANQILTQLIPLADTSSVTASAVTIGSTMLDGKRTNITLASNICTEALYAYIMRQWCSEHKPSRVQFYDQLFTESCHSAVIALKSKRKPALNDLGI